MSKITFTERAFAEYLYWQSQDKKTLKRINALPVSYTHLTLPTTERV